MPVAASVNFEQDVKLWQVNIPVEDSSIAKKLLEEAKERCLSGNQHLNPAFTLSYVFPRPPAEMLIHLVTASARAMASVHFERDSSTGGHYKSAITFKLKSAGTFNYLGDRHLQDNHITPVVSPPEVVARLLDRLTRKRYITDSGSDVNFPQDFGDLFSEYFQHAAASEAIDQFDQPMSAEIAGHNHILWNAALCDRELYQQYRTSHVRGLLLEFLYTVRVGLGRSCHSGFQMTWPFPLLVSTDDDTYQYTPESAFCMAIRNIPHLIIDVCLDTTAQRDEILMLLQASCLARLGNRFRGQNSDPMIVMAIYIDKSFSASRYLLYQSDVSEQAVEYYKEEFELHNAQRAFEFMFQLYNFLSGAVVQDKALNDPQALLGNLSSSVAGYPSLLAAVKPKAADNDPDGYYTQSSSGTASSFGN